MKTLAISLAFALSPALAIAAETPTAQKVISSSLEESVRADAAAALTALESGDFRSASLYLKTAGDNANRLSLQSVAKKIQVATPTFEGDAAEFTLAGSSTIEFENLLSASNTFEQRFKDERGNVVTVRVFGEDNDLKDFMFIASDEAMLEKGKIEVAEMRGETALKRKNSDGGLSVLMMSEEDHALVEVQGDSEDAVMAFISELEATNN